MKCIRVMSGTGIWTRVKIALLRVWYRKQYERRPI